MTFKLLVIIGVALCLVGLAIAVALVRGGNIRRYPNELAGTREPFVLDPSTDNEQGR